MPGPTESRDMGRLDPFFDVMCQYRDFIWLGVMVVLFLFILTVFSLLLADPGSGSQAIALFNLALVLVLGTSMLALYRGCLKREAQGY